MRSDALADEEAIEPLLETADLTRQLISENGLTALMVTHNMKDALALGNRMIMMHEGTIILDLDAEEKRHMTVEDLLAQFEKASGRALSNDRMLLT